MRARSASAIHRPTSPQAGVHRSGAYQVGQHLRGGAPVLCGAQRLVPRTLIRASRVPVLGPARRWWRPRSSPSTNAGRASPRTKVQASTRSHIGSPTPLVPKSITCGQPAHLDQQVAHGDITLEPDGSIAHETPGAASHPCALPNIDPVGELNQPTTGLVVVGFRRAAPVGAVLAGGWPGGRIDVGQCTGTGDVLRRPWLVRPADLAVQRTDHGAQ